MKTPIHPLYYFVRRNPISLYTKYDSLAVCCKSRVKEMYDTNRVVDHCLPLSWEKYLMIRETLESVDTYSCMECWDAIYFQFL